MVFVLLKVKREIITAGMIGVGKTTLTGKIAEHLNTKAFFEPVGENPVLPLYYKDPKQYGFLLQIYFLNKRFSMIKQALSDDNNVSTVPSTRMPCLLGRTTRKVTSLTPSLRSILTSITWWRTYSSCQRRHQTSGLPETDFETPYRIKTGPDYEQIDNNPELKDYYYKMWSAYKQWYKDTTPVPRWRSMRRMIWRPEERGNGSGNDRRTPTSTVNIRKTENYSRSFHLADCKK